MGNRHTRNPSALRSRITIERRVDDPAMQGPAVESGGYELLDNWQPVMTVWANIRHMTGKELEEGHREAEEATCQIRFRYSRALREIEPHRWRIAHRHAIYTIVHVVDEDDRHELYRALCKEVTPWATASI